MGRSSVLIWMLQSLLPMSYMHIDALVTIASVGRCVAIEWSQLSKACGMRGAKAWFVIMFTFRVWTNLFRFGG